MSIKVNKELCLGCGACASLCPDVFKMNDAGKSEVISSASASSAAKAIEDKEASADKEENIACAKNAAESCPVQAIEVHPVKSPLKRGAEQFNGVNPVK